VSPNPPEAPVRTDSFRPVLGATVLLVLAFLAIAALKSSRDLEAAHARERLLQTRIAETRVRSERLRVRIERLRHDPGMLERLAREDLGMVRPRDVIIELPNTAGPSAPPRLRGPHLPGPPLPKGEEGEKQNSSLPAGVGAQHAAPSAAPSTPPQAPPPPALPSAAPPAPG
jgi:cell division protein FtsB